MGRLEDLLLWGPAARVSALALASAVLVSGCSSQIDTEPEVPELWRTQIDQMLAGDGVPISDVHREILADHAISDAEYGELRQLLSDCLTGHGIEHDMDTEGGSFETTDLAGDSDGTRTLDLTTECMDTTTGPVESIYLGMRENPEGLGRGEALRRCLDDGDVAEFAGVSADELERLIMSAELMPTTPEAVLCQYDPFGDGGLTLERAREILAEEQREVPVE